MSADGDTPVAIRLVRVRVPLLVAHRAAHGTEELRDVVLVELQSASGALGWGECPTLSRPGYPVGTTDEAWEALLARLAPAAFAPTERPEGPWRTAGVPSTAPLLSGAERAATAALEDARLDALLHRAGRSLVEHLGATRRRLPRTAVLASLGGDPSVIAAQAREEVARGAHMVKVKIRPGDDVAVLRHVLDATGGRPVAADANGSFAHPEELAEVDELGLAYLEQPFPPDSGWSDLADRHAALRTPVALDESIGSLGALRDAIDAGAASIVSIKPARLGGMAAAASGLDLAAMSGVDAFVGGLLELGVGRAGAAAVAALEGATLPTDLGPSARYVASDVSDPIVTDERGDLVVPDGIGIGREPDPERLAAWMIDEARLSA